MADNTARKWCSQLQEGVSGAEKNVEDTKHTLYDEWIQGVPYYENDYVLHNGKLYICVTTTDSEPGTTVDWIEVNVAEELSHLHTEVTALNSKISEIGTQLRLGFTQLTKGTEQVISLDDNINNYRELYITVGYYNTGFPSYGSTVVFTKVGIWESVAQQIRSGEMVIYPNGSNSLKVKVTEGSSGNYVAVYGIK